MFRLARTLNKTDDSEERKKLGATLIAGGDLMGLIQENPDKWFVDGADGELSADNIEMMLTEREKARSNKNFTAADAIRDRLADCGIQIEDSVEGTRWRRT